MDNHSRSDIVTIPNILSGLRLLLGPLLLYVAWEGERETFIIVLVISFLLDLVDGPIARLTNRVTELGPQLDTWADFSIYITLPIGAWWLWPEIIQREWIFVGMAVASIIVPTVVGILRFHRPTSYHTWLTKFAVVCFAPSVILLLLNGPAWPFRISAVIALLAAVEQTAITLVSRNRLSDIPSLFHLLRRNSGT